MSELATTTGYRLLSGLLDAPPAERAPLYQLLLTSTAGWARAIRKISASRAGPQTQPRKECRFHEVDIVAKINTDPTINGIGEILHPRQDAAHPSAAAFREGRDADPQNIPPLAAKFREAPRAPQGPAHRGAFGPEKSIQRRNGCRTPFLDAERPTPHYPRVIIAGEVAIA